MSTKKYSPIERLTAATLWVAVMTNAQAPRIQFASMGGEMSNSWQIINDSVMGGRSQSEVIITEQKNILFSGDVSFENNGGFASARHSQEAFGLAGGRGVLLRLRGDGKKYQFRVRTSNWFDSVSYKSTFQTKENEWQEIDLPWSSFVPTYRGRTLTDAEKLDPTQIKQVGFLIADEQEGSFALVVKDIHPLQINEF